MYFTPTLARLISEQMEAAWAENSKDPLPGKLPVQLSWDLNYRPGEYHESNDPSANSGFSERIIHALNDLHFDRDAKGLLDSLVNAGIAAKDASRHENNNGYFGSDLYLVDVTRLKKVASN